MHSLPAKMKILLIPKKTLEKQKLNFSRRASLHMKTRNSLNYFVNDCRLIRICRIQWQCSHFLFQAENTLFRKIWSKKGNIRKVSKLHRMVAQCLVLRPKLKFCQYQQKVFQKQKLNLSLSALCHMKIRVTIKYFVNDCRLMRICRTQWWCSLSLFQIGNTLFGKIWSKKSNVSVKAKIKSLD